MPTSLASAQFACRQDIIYVNQTQLLDSVASVLIRFTLEVNSDE
jgi:hypothetical protein